MCVDVGFFNFALNLLKLNVGLHLKKEALWILVNTIDCLYRENCHK